MPPFISWLSAALLLSSSVARPEQPAALAWRAGAAKANITPARFMWMSGYAARTTPAQGKLSDLWAKALVLEDATRRRAVLVTMDLVGIPRDLAQAVCDELWQKHQLPRQAVMLSASHTHSGPVVGSNLRVMYQCDAAQEKLIDEYATDLQNKLVALVGEALNQLAPAELSWGNGHVTFAVNRRNNKETDVPRLRDLGKLKGPVDHDAPVLAVRDPQGQLRAIVCGYACHATVLSGYDWSGDYPGCAQSELEKTHPQAIALFWAGCGGDQNPVPRRTAAWAQEYGHQLAEGVEGVLRAPMTPVEGKLSQAYTEIDLPFDDLPSRDQLVKDSAAANVYIALRAKHLLRQIENNGSLRGTYPYPVQTWQLGRDLTWIALGGEVVVDYSLRLKRELGPSRTWVAAYANDVMAYIPSLRVLKEGGYEGGGAMVYYGLPATWRPQIEELIVAAVQEQVRKVRADVPAEK